MERLKNNWWKFLGALLVIYSVIAGLIIEVPQLPIIEQTIRNVFFHVPMWFAMIFIFLLSVVYSIKYLSDSVLKNDIMAIEAVNVGLLFGSLGLITGMAWARFTWGAFWVNDPKLNGAAVSMLAYFAYVVLRSSVPDKHKKARLAAVYNIFAFVLLLVFIGILPRIADGSLHPGSGGDSPFAVAKMHGHMYLIFWPAVIGWILVGIWLLKLRIELRKDNFNN
ncbi:MAG: cytochrome c biogenesis protein [Bacteroidales bacterium]|nr:cytochrome c biogenesis protein [Bacteroidales bacterium]